MILVLMLSSRRLVRIAARLGRVLRLRMLAIIFGGRLGRLGLMLRRIRCGVRLTIRIFLVR